MIKILVNSEAISKAHVPFVTSLQFAVLPNFVNVLMYSLYCILMNMDSYQAKGKTVRSILFSAPKKRYIYISD